MGIFSRKNGPAAKIANMNALISAHASGNTAAIGEYESRLLSLPPDEALGAIRAVTKATIPEGIRSAPGFRETLTAELKQRSNIPEVSIAVQRIGFEAIVNCDNSAPLVLAIEETLAPAGNAFEGDITVVLGPMIAEAYGNTLGELGLAELLEHEFGGAVAQPE